MVEVRGGELLAYMSRPAPRWALGACGAGGVSGTPEECARAVRGLVLALSVMSE